MTRRALSVSQLVDDANRARERLEATIDQLRHNLTPSQLFDEWARSSGVKGLTAQKALQFAVSRHPVPTVLIGAGLGFFAYSALRRTKAYNREIDLTPNPQGKDREFRPPGKITNVVSSLAEPAMKVFRERAKAKSEEVMNRAKSHVTSAAQQLSGAVERTLDDWLTGIPGPHAAHPILVSAVQLLIVAAFQAVFPKLTK
ncbi:hypothetical protein SAMN05444161_8590 [Rhizobiales bacterium GAS191]|nr:hypothetical protein SAMN05444161_8590 [Rhizobiales bacterium GAS191]